MVDSFLADMLLEVGGYLVFDDLWMVSVRKAVNFAIRNREYVVDLASSVNPRPNALVSLGRIAKRILSWPPGQCLKVAMCPKNLIVVRKMCDDDRDWDFHRQF